MKKLDDNKAKVRCKRICRRYQSGGICGQTNEIITGEVAYTCLLRGWADFIPVKFVSVRKKPRYPSCE